MPIRSRDAGLRQDAAIRRFKGRREATLDPFGLGDEDLPVVRHET